MTTPLQDLTVRLTLDDKLSASLRAAIDVLGRLGGQAGASVKPAQAALVELDKQGRAALERLAVGSQESAAAVAQSIAGIEQSVNGADLGSGLGSKLQEGAQGLSLLDAGATKLAGSLTGLAAGFVTVTQAVQLATQAFVEARQFEDTFARIPLDLSLSAKAAREFGDSLKEIASQRNLPVQDVIAAATKAIQEGAQTQTEVLDVLSASLDLVQARLATLPEAVNLVTGRLGALGLAETEAGREAATLATLLSKSGTSAQQLAAGFDRLIPKARDVGASASDIDKLFLILREGGRTAEDSFAAIESFLNEAFTDEGQKRFAEFGIGVTKADIALRGLIAPLQEAAEKYGDNEAAITALTSKGGGLSRILTTLAADTGSVARQTDALANSQENLEARLRASTLSVDALFDRFEARIGRPVQLLGDAFLINLTKQLEVAERLISSFNFGGVSIPGFEDAQAQEERALQIRARSGDATAKLTLELRGAQAEAERLAATLLKVQEQQQFREGRNPSLRGQSDKLIGDLTSEATAAQAEVNRLREAIAALKPPAPLAPPIFDFRQAVADLDLEAVQEQATRALESISLPPLAVGFTIDLPKDVEKAAEGLRDVLEKSTVSPADLAAVKEYLATVQQFTKGQADAQREAEVQADRLLATLRARALDGTERQVAESKILLDSIAKQIDAYAAEGLAVDDLRKALEGLRAAEARRAETDSGKRARELADQRGALADRVDGLGAGLASGLDAAFAAIDDKVRAATDAVEKFREARIAAGTATPAELAGLDALIAKAIGLKAALRDDARTKLGENLAASLRDVDAAVAGLGKGLQTGLDATFSDIDGRVQGVLDRIAKARADAAKAGILSPEDVARLDDAANKARLLGDALKFDAQTADARELLGVLAEITAEAQSAALAGLPDAARQFGQAAIDLRIAQSDARSRILEDAQIRGLSPDQAAELAQKSVDALRFQFEQDANRLVLDFALRPQIQIEEEALLRQIQDRLDPFREQIEKVTAAAIDPSGDGGISKTADEVRAIAAAWDEARIAAEGFRQEIVQGSEAFESGFSATIRDRITQYTNDFATGAKLAGTAFDALGNSLGDAFLAIVDGSKSASEAFKDFIKSFLASIAQAITQALAFQAVAGIFGGLGFGASGGSFGGAAPNLPADGIFAQGGIMPGEMQKPVGFADGGVMPGAMSILSDGKRLPTVNYAQGGVARSPQMAVFAEKPGMAEAFVPLPGPDRGIPVEFKNLPSAAEDDGGPPSNVTQNTVSVSFAIQALDGASVREILAREARTIEDLVASAVSSGANRGLMESVRSAGNPSRG